MRFRARARSAAVRKAGKSFWKNKAVARAQWAKWLVGADATARCAAARARPSGSGLRL